MIFKNRKSSLCLDVLFMLFIAVVCVWNLKDIGHIRVVDDEFVYWGIGAALSGYDWKDLLSVSQYYSFGYSFLLVPLFWLTKIGVSMTAIYRIAIFFNVLFLWGSYFTSCKILKELDVKLPDTMKQIASFVAVLYIGNMVQINLAWTECCLCLVYWLILYSLVHVCKKPNYKNTFFLQFFCAYIFMVHMRAIGVVIAAGIVFALYVVVNFKSINKKWAIFVIIEEILLIIITFALKNVITASIYLGGTMAVESTNNVGANLEKTQSLLSVAGLLDLFMSMLGKLYYAGTATLMLAFVGMIVVAFILVQKVIQWKKEKRGFQVGEWIGLFILLAFLGENVVSAIFKCFRYFSADMTSTKGDTIVFGRYSDFVVGPMIILGIYALYHIKTYAKEIIVACLLFAVCVICVQFQFNVLSFYGQDANVGFRWNSAYWLGVFYRGDLTYFAFYVAFISSLALIMLCLCTVIGKEKKYLYGIALTIIAVFWGICGIKNSSDYIEEKQFKEKSITTVYQVVTVADEELPIYLAYENTDKIVTDIKVLQWMLKERPIKKYKVDENEIENLKEAVILCDASQVNRMAMLSDRFDFIYNSGTIAVFISKENSCYNNMLKKARQMNQVADPTVNYIELADVTTEYSYVHKNGDLYYNYQAPSGAYMTGDMGVVLDDGTYVFSVDIRIRDCQKGSNVGYITVGDMQGNIQDTYVLKADEFVKNERQSIHIPIEIEGMQTPFIGIYTYGEASIRIFDIFYQKIKNNVEFTAEKMEALLEGIPNDAMICYVDSDESGKTGFPFVEICNWDYLTGGMVEFKENFDAEYYLVEKNLEKNIEDVFGKMTLIKEESEIMLYMNDKKPFVE